MLKAFIDRIIEIGKPHIEIIGDRTYSDKTLNLITEPKPLGIGLSTLTSLVDYIAANRDELDLDKLVIHVESPTRIRLFSNLRENNQRFLYIFAELPSDCQFNQFGEYLDQESMVIALQTFFEQDGGGLKGLQKIVGGLQSGKSLLVKDDGITQSTEVKTGISNWTHTEVTDGISEGEEVVISQGTSTESTSGGSSRPYWMGGRR